MSFALEVKEEIISHYFTEYQQLMLLRGFIKYSSNLLLEKNQWKLQLDLLSNKITRNIYTFLKNLYPHEIIISIMQTSKLKKQKIYHLILEKDVKKFLKNFDIYDIDKNHKIIKIQYKDKNNEKNLRAYLSGIFIACGSVNSPKTSNYHLELQFKEKESAEYFLELTKKFNFNFKIIERKDNIVCYLKKSTSVSDFLKLIDAPNSVLTFENERISRDFSNSLNRVNNVDIYNQMKTTLTSDKQIEQINSLIEKGKVKELSIKNQKLIELRLNNPSYSFQELTIEMNALGISITKSGVSNLFKIIEQMYKNLEE
ncbi:DNA-binding protein WhiA [Spiroplasma endosymbiont of Labia minor]|uniref:DNA-binding protein WhiA n=1 Tax=Spiroplasma endosymbiont of Labia minor TaxID=3066305 RepID=UPI0030D14B99